MWSVWAVRFLAKILSKATFYTRGLGRLTEAGSP